MFWITSPLVLSASDHPEGSTIETYYLAWDRMTIIESAIEKGEKKLNHLGGGNKEHQCSFRDIWPDSKPLFKLFRTEARGYLYDTGTNKILACNDLEYDLLNNLARFEVQEALDRTAASCPPHEFDEVLNGIRADMEKKNILITKKASQFGLSSHFINLSEVLNTALGMIQLEITERCNLRCDYCIYNSFFKDKRNHGTKDMSQEVAFRAIDYLARCSKYKEDVAVTYYGGEPLIRFAFIQSCVRYAHQVLRGKRLRYSLTTNATLITPEIAKYFAQEGFGVHVSLDGPPDIHDQYRKDSNKCGSFNETVSGLKNLFDAYDGQFNNISLSMVYAPPYSERKVNRIAELWDELSWLPKDISINISYAQGFFPPITQTYTQNRRDFSLFEWTKKKFTFDYKNGSGSHPLNSAIEKKLASIAQRPTYSAPLDKYYLYGCCIPGVR